MWEVYFIQIGKEFFFRFKKLGETLDDVRSTEIGEKSGNVTKNRFECYLPHDRNRVILQPVLGHVDASYINASVVKVIDCFFLIKF